MVYHESYSWLAASFLPTTLAEIQSNINRGFVEKKKPEDFFSEFCW